jgi:integrase
MKQKITQSLVERVRPDVKTILYSDTELRGFYLIVTPAGNRSFYVQSAVRGKQVRTKLGDHPALDARQARDLARRTLVAMRGGVNPNEQKRKERAKSITLREALDLHLSTRTLSPRTSDDYRYNCGQYLSDWLDKPLVELGADRAAVRERHVRITTKNGAPSADNVFRIFRAIYSRALREHPDLPANPTANVDYHGLRRRKVDAPAAKLLAWGQAVLGLHPVRRDLHLIMMLTGMRRTSVCEALAADLHLDERRLHVPKPKGGAARAFDLPLSAPLIDMLGHRVGDNARLYRRGTPWIFPADSESGHVAEVAQAELGGLTGHALRHCFATLALQAGTPLLELKFLLNHAASSVTHGYLNPSLDHLRKHQEAASRYILSQLGLVWTDGTWPPRSVALATVDRSTDPLTVNGSTAGAQVDELEAEPA